MRFHMRMRCQTIVVLCYAALLSANQDYDNKLTKYWTISSASKSNGSPVINVTSASIVIQPSSYSSDPIAARTSRVTKILTPYAFRPRAIPLKRVEESPQEKNIYYTQDNKYKTEILFPGNYFAIPKEKSVESKDGKDGAYNPLRSEPFEPKTIPLIQDQGIEKRSLDVAMDPIIENLEELPEQQQSSRRSLSYILGADDEEDTEDDEDGEEEFEETDSKGGLLHHNKIKHKIKRAKKYSKYMTPLLLAYKLKYFALVPVMIGGLVLLVGATGLAGFFFALFAAVMGLQKGGY